MLLYLRRLLRSRQMIDRRTASELRARGVRASFRVPRQRRRGGLLVRLREALR